MKIGEHSRVTEKYLDPQAYLLSLFPTSRECMLCHTMIHLETIHDVKHETYTHEHAAYRKDWLEWVCPVCYKRNQFTAESVLVNAHRKMIRSDVDTREYIGYAVIGIFFLMMLYGLFTM